MSDPQYPVGKFTWPEKVDDGDRRTYIQQIEEAASGRVLKMRLGLLTAG